MSSGGLLAFSSSESDIFALLPFMLKFEIPSLSPLLLLFREAICGRRLRTVTAGLKSCLSGTEERAST